MKGICNNLYPIFLFLIIPIVFMSSCSTPKDLEYRSFKNFKAEKIGFVTSTFNVDIVYFNPNNFGLELKRTDLDVYIDNTYLGHTQQNFQIHIPRKGEFIVPIKLDVDMKNAYKNALPSLVGKEVLVKVVGQVKVGKANVYKNFKVNFESKQKFSL